MFFFSVFFFRYWFVSLSFFPPLSLFVSLIFFFFLIFLFSYIPIFSIRFSPVSFLGRLVSEAVDPGQLREATERAAKAEKENIKARKEAEDLRASLTATEMEVKALQRELGDIQVSPTSKEEARVEREQEGKRKG